MSRLHERKCYTRWSDPTLRKTCSFHWTPTSEEEVISLRQSQLSPPLLSVAQRYAPLKGTSSEYCLCGKQCSRRKSSSSSYDSRDIKEVLENLELHLTGTQVEEALAEDRQTALIQHLDLSTAALEALAQYGQTLKVSQSAACRVLNISHLLALPQPYSTNSKSDSTHLTIPLQQLEVQRKNKLTILKDLIEHCSKHMVLPKHLCELMNDHYVKKRDFCVAAKNFKNFLSNSKLSITQMEKLNQQYGTILNDYQQSRHILDLELPKVINMRLTILQEGFEKIKEFYSDADDNTEIVTLFKSIGEKLCTDNSATARVAHNQLSPKFELCQKCKVNRVDGK